MAKEDIDVIPQKLLTTTLAAIALCVMTAVTHAAVIPVTTVFGHNEKTNYTGTITDTIIGSGMNGYGVDGVVGWPTGEGDPSTWTATTNSYGAEWQSGALLSGATNSKIGWIVFDMGSSVTGLDKFYIWNERENTARATNAYNIYYAVTPTVAVTHGPTNSNTLDYNFASGGWTQVGSTANMTYGGSSANAVINLGGVTARYLAVEILSNGVGATGDATRVGLAEVGITAIIPEPASLALFALGTAMILPRRRSR